MTEHTGTICNLPFLFRADVTLKRMGELLDMLGKEHIWVEYKTFEFCNDGLWCEALCKDRDDMKDFVNELTEGDVILDKDSTDWYDWLEEDE